MENQQSSASFVNNLSFHTQTSTDSNAAAAAAAAAASSSQQQQQQARLSPEEFAARRTSLIDQLKALVERCNKEDFVTISRDGSRDQLTSLCRKLHKLLVRNGGSEDDREACRVLHDAGVTLRSKLNDVDTSMKVKMRALDHLKSVLAGKDDELLANILLSIGSNMAVENKDYDVSVSMMVASLEMKKRLYEFPPEFSLVELDQPPSKEDVRRLGFKRVENIALDLNAVGRTLREAGHPIEGLAMMRTAMLMRQATIAVREEDEPGGVTAPYIKDLAVSLLNVGIHSADVQVEDSLTYEVYQKQLARSSEEDRAKKSAMLPSLEECSALIAKSVELVKTRVFFDEERNVVRDDALIAICVNALGKVEFECAMRSKPSPDLKRRDAAIALRREALAIRERLGGKDRAHTMAGLGRNLVTAGQHQEGLRLLRQGHSELVDVARKVGKASNDFLQHCKLYAACLAKCGFDEEAQKVLAERQKMIDEQHTDENVMEILQQMSVNAHPVDANASFDLDTLRQNSSGASYEIKTQVQRRDGGTGAPAAASAAAAAPSLGTGNNDNDDDERDRRTVAGSVKSASDSQRYSGISRSGRGQLSPADPNGMPFDASTVKESTNTGGEQQQHGVMQSSSSGTDDPDEGQK